MENYSIPGSNAIEKKNNFYNKHTQTNLKSLSKGNKFRGNMNFSLNVLIVFILKII